jgi:hypothetical protein
VLCCLISLFLGFRFCRLLFFLLWALGDGEGWGRETMRRGRTLGGYYGPWGGGTKVRLWDPLALASEHEGDAVPTAR